MNIGILGTGSIAEKMSATINKMNNAHLYAVASRTAEKAKSFSERYHIENYYATYEELAQIQGVGDKMGKMCFVKRLLQLMQSRLKKFLSMPKAIMFLFQKQFGQDLCL